MKQALMMGLMVLGLVGACGGDDKGKATPDGGAGGSGGVGQGGKGGGPVPIDLGLDKNKPVDQLTPDERTQACDELQDWSESFARQVAPKVCEIAVVVGLLQQNPGMAASSCPQAIAACSASPPDAGFPADATNMCAAVQTDCKATVGEVETCTNDTVAALDAYIDLWPTCEDLAANMASFPLQTPQDPPSCTRIKPECPELPLLSELLDEILDN